MNVTKHIICELTGYRPGTVDVSQSDRSSRAVSCRLLENGAAWMIPEGSTARIAYTLPDGTEGLYDRRPDGTPMWEIAKNTVTVELADQLMAQAGMAQVSIVLIGPEGGQLATWPIRVMVTANKAARLTVPEAMPPYGAGFAGKIFFGGADGTVTPLEVGEGAEIVRRDDGTYTLVVYGGTGGGADLTGYATEDWVRQGYQPKGKYLLADSLDEAIQDALTEAEASGKFGGTDFDTGYIDERGYLHLTKDGADIPGFDPFYVGSGGPGGGYGSTLKLSCSLESRVFSIMGEEKTCVLPFTWTSVDDADGGSTGPGTASWSVNGSRVATYKVEQGDNTYDIRQYLVSGQDNTVILTVSDSYDNSKTLTFVIGVASYGLTWNLGNMAYHGTDVLNISLTPTGSGDKTIKVTLDGTEVLSQVVSTSGRKVPLNIPAQSHAPHTILAWMEVEIAGETIRTEPLRHVGLWTVEGNPKKVVGVYQPEMTVPQFGTVTIQYMVVDPAGDLADVELRKDDETLSVVKVDRGIQAWAYKARTVGTDNLSVVCGTASAAVKLIVESLGYNIQPVTAGLVLDIDPSGHSNTEQGREMFGYTDGLGVNHPFAYSENFDWVNGGFRQDSDGAAAFVIKRGCYVTLDCSLFADNPKTLGKNIKLIYKSDLVRDYDATLMTCKAGSVGMVIRAQDATVTSELETMTVPYCEGRKIEMDISIEPTSEDSLAMICMKSVPSCKPIQYGSTDSWTQAVPARLVIGSEDCDVWIYRIKMYANYLNRYEILDNYIADCGDPAEMVERYVRNDIFADDGSVSLTRLAEKAPNLRVIHIKAKRMTTGKSDEVAADLEMIYSAGGAAHHLTAKDIVFKAQGTSSLEYVLGALNLDIDFSGASSWVNGNGDAITEYAFSDNAIPVDYFNLKANVASSESANNVVLADDYNSFNPYICDPRKQDPRVRDCVEGHPCAVFFTNTSDAPVEAGARTVQPNETILYFAGDMNNSKKNLAVFGQDAARYPRQCCVEVLNNTNAPCRFRGSDWDNETWDGKGKSNFEFRAPKNGTDEMKAAFRAMHSWVNSTCRDQATGAELDNGVSYNGVMYWYDSPEYRAAKFVAEFEDYFVKSNMLFHYLFTERHCMSDNRAKNVFFCYEYVAELDDYRWSVRCNYDNDTAEGCDNSGGATFTYGLEDIDTVGNTPVYNAADSTLWCNIRDLMFEDLQSAYVSNKECWSAERILKKFLDHQMATPEAVRIDDMYNKYIMPLLLKNDSSYLKRCFGTKEYWREQFEVYQEIYMNSKYCDLTDRSNAITARVTTQNAEAGNIDITPYSDMYIVVMYGNGGTARMRAKRGNTYTILCPADTLTDTETYMYSASHLKEIGSMAAMVPKFVTLTHAHRLQAITIGSQEAGYENLNYTDQTNFANNPLLEYLDISGLPNMVYALDMSKQVGLQELYAVWSGITGVTFAKGAPLRIARLPELANLKAQDLEKIEVFEMDGRNLTSILVENCPGIDTLALCKAAKDLNRARLPGIDWHDTDADTLLRLAALGGMDADGEIIDKVVLTGKAHLDTATSEELAQLEELLPDVEITYDKLVTGMTVTFVNYDGTVLNTQVVRYGKDAVNPITAGYIETPVKPPTDTKMYIYKGWSDYFTNVTTDLTITAVFTETDRVCVVRWWKDLAETELLQEDIVDVMGSAYYQGDDLPDGTETVWLGWDKSANLVSEDMNIHARYVVPSLPQVSIEEYDYLYSDDPADKSAYSIADFYGICLSDNPEMYFNIGDEIKIVLPCNAWTTLGDTPIVLQVAGYRHFRKADGSGEFAKVVFVMKTSRWSRKMNATNTNAGGWYATELRSWLIGTVFPLLPAHWRRMIELVEVTSTRGEALSTTVTANDRLFLLAVREVGLTGDFCDDQSAYYSEIDSEAENRQLPLFTDDASRKKGSIYWLRSPVIKDYKGNNGTTNFRIVGPNGQCGTYFLTHGANSFQGAATTSFGVVFGFCIG